MSGVDAHIFEVVMLFCFGISWPFAIAKTIRTKVVTGKSIIFIILVVIGYLSGIVSKLMGHFDHVIWLYAINGTMVFTEMVLYFRYHRSDAHRQRRIVSPKWQAPARSGKPYALDKTTVSPTPQA